MNQKSSHRSDSASPAIRLASSALIHHSSFSTMTAATHRQIHPIHFMHTRHHVLTMEINQEYSGPLQHGSPIRGSAAVGDFGGFARGGPVAEALWPASPSFQPGYGSSDAVAFHGNAAWGGAGVVVPEGHAHHAQGSTLAPPRSFVGDVGGTSSAARMFPGDGAQLPGEAHDNYGEQFVSRGDHYNTNTLLATYRLQRSIHALLGQLCSVGNQFFHATPKKSEVIDSANPFPERPFPEISLYHHKLWGDIFPPNATISRRRLSYPNQKKTASSSSSSLLVMVEGDMDWIRFNYC
ncbi:hypothetical protein ACP70R_039289 [Stipagrostis hirtigluma subsp. patula]